MSALKNRRLHLTILALFGVSIATSVVAIPDMDADFVATAVQRVGPVAIILLVALGIVVSPIPSGAVALVAGALFGTVVGGALTILGAGLGASCAFALSRYVGRGQLLCSRSSVARFLTHERSQRALMLGVFLTRLVPFISFDAVSYLAGLTPLTFWRFFIATVSGTAPVCIAFAAAGSSAAADGLHPAMLVTLSGITLMLPLCALVLRSIHTHGRSRRFNAPATATVTPS